MGALWEHLLSAQDNEMGVPEAFIEAKKAEIQARQVGAAFEIQTRIGTKTYCSVNQFAKSQNFMRI